MSGETGRDSPPSISKLQVSPHDFTSYMSFVSAVSLTPRPETLRGKQRLLLLQTDKRLQPLAAAVSQPPLAGPPFRERKVPRALNAGAQTRDAATSRIILASLGRAL